MYNKEPNSLRLPGEILDFNFLSSMPLIYLPIDDPSSFRVHHTPRGSPARMLGFTNDLTNFQGFPASGAIILNFLGCQKWDVRNYQWIRHFQRKFRFGPPRRYTKWKDLATKNPWTYKKGWPELRKISRAIGKSHFCQFRATFLYVQGFLLARNFRRKCLIHW